MRKVFRITIALLVLSLLVGGVNQVLACVSKPPVPPPKIWVYNCGDTDCDGLIEFKIYMEVQIFPPPTQPAWCACGIRLPFLPGAGVQAEEVKVLILNTDTGATRPLTLNPDNPNPFSPLAPNPVTTRVLRQQLQGGWFGFFGRINPFQFNPQLAPSERIVICFLVELSPPVIRQFRPGEIAFGAGLGLPGGSPDFGDPEHPFEVFQPEDPRLEPLPILPPLPGEWPGEVNGDGIFSLPELEHLSNNWLARCPVFPPVIPEIQAIPEPDLQAGGVVELLGDFGPNPNPDQWCAAVRFQDPAGNNGGAVPIRIVEAQPNRLLGEVGLIDPEIGQVQGQLMLMPGNGVVGMPKFIFPEIQPIEPVWTWHGENQPVAVAPVDVLVNPTLPPPNTEWFFGKLIDGRLEVELCGSWCPEAVVTITARAHDACIGLDLEGPQTRFVGGGSALQCAKRIKDFLECAFLTQSGQNISVQIERLGNGCVKIIVCLTNGKPITWGLLNICVTPAECPPIVVIDDFIPKRNWRPDDVIQIFGQGFPQNPDDLCIVTEGGAILEAMFVEHLGNNAQVIGAKVLPHAPGEVQPGNLMVHRGVGQRNPLEGLEAFGAQLVGRNPWVWQPVPGDDEGVDNGDDIAVPDPDAGDDGCTYFNFYEDSEGKRCLLARLENDWSEQGLINIFLRAYCPARSPDVTIEQICTPPGLSANACATMICFAIEQAYANAGIPEMECEVLNIGGVWHVKICYEDCDITGPTWRDGENPSRICFTPGPCGGSTN